MVGNSSGAIDCCEWVAFPFETGMVSFPAAVEDTFVEQQHDVAAEGSATEKVGAF